jgi:multidrug efflux pump subunit AcrA (membrane-fusion protein)
MIAPEARIPVEVAPKSLALVKRRKVRGRILSVGLFFVVLTAGLGFIPWQQTIEGAGQVMIFNAMDRPQSVAAPIPARLVEWKVQEGDIVQKGKELLLLEDVDSKFLDQNLTTRLTEQRKLTVQALTETEVRVQDLQKQKFELIRSRDNALGAAR